MKAGSVITAAVAFALGFAAGYVYAGDKILPSRPDVRVLVARDTVRIAEPASSVVRRLPAEPVRVAVADTASCSSDSATVYLPLSQAVYEGESYKAFVSGYRPRLDSLFIFRNAATVSVAAPSGMPRRRASRFSVGVQAGYGITPRGFQPYIGVGISFRLAEF